MKTIGNFLNKKTIARPNVIDQQTVFYIFGIVIKEEYGKQGSQNIRPAFFSDRKIFIKASGETWSNEIIASKNLIITRINEQLGGNEILDLVLAS